MKTNLTLLYLIIGFSSLNSLSQTTETFNTPGTTTWTVPGGIDQIEVEAIGGGGGGGPTFVTPGDSQQSGGGGSGAYSKSILNVIPGEEYYIVVGSGAESTSSSDPGEDSWFAPDNNVTNATVLAKGGSSVGTNVTAGGAGGLAVNGTGNDTTQDGNDGGDVSGGNSGTGGDAPNGGTGGSSVSGNNDGINGGSPGAGGSGSSAFSSGSFNFSSGGFGGDGQIKITYTRIIQTTSGNWNDTSNWENGVVPTLSDNAAIDDGITSTLIQDQDVNNLSLNNNSQVDINSGFSLNVKANIINNSQFTGDGEVILNGSTNQELKGDGAYENLRLNNGSGADITSSTVINGVLYVDNGTFTTNDAVTFPCDFSSTNNRVGQIGEVTGTISGDVTVEQCFPARRAFRLISSSTNTNGSAKPSIQDNWQEGATAYDDSSVPANFGTHITGNNTSQTDNSLNNGLDWSPSGSSSLFTFDNSAQSWNAVNNTKDNTLSAGDPYRLMVRGARKDAVVGLFDITSNATDPTNTKLRSTGSVEQGQVTFSNINNDTPVDENASLIGNPYQALVDMNAVINSSTNLQQFFIIWDPTLGGNNPTPGQPGGRGAFVTVDATNGDTSIDGGTTGNDPDMKYLQPYQAAFVFASSGGSSPQVVFEESHKSVSQSQVQVFSDGQNSHYLNVRLFDDTSYSNGATPDDGVQFYFSENSSNAINDVDAPKFNNIDENLATWSENTALLSIENRAMPTDNDSLQLYNTQYRDTDYVFELELGSFPDNDVYLYDAHADQQILLNEDTVNTYSYSVDPSISSSVAWNRFNIIFEQDTFSTSDEELKNEIKLFPNPANDFVNINFGDLNLSEAQISISDMQGRQIKTIDKEDISTDQIRVNTSDLSQGIYFVRINSGQFQHTAKLIVE